MVAPRSSTSSSSRLPWAVVLAFALVVGLDRLTFRDEGPWEYFAARVPKRRVLDVGVVQDRLALRRLSAAPPDRARVVAVGTSRVKYGIRLSRARPDLPWATVEMLAHAHVNSFEIRALVDRLIAVRVDAVVLLLSEFDTHRPVVLEPVPGTGVGNLGAVAELVTADPAFAVRNRDTVFRLITSSALGAYRYREIVREAGFDALRVFPHDRRWRSASRPRRDRPNASRGEEPRDDPAWPRLARMFSPAQRYGIRRQVGWIREITAGPHAALHMALLRRSVALLRRAGAQVIVIEAPLHPAAADLYHVELRAEFLVFVDELVREYGVHFVSLEQLAPFRAEDFGDLQHLRLTGASRVTAAAVGAVREALSVGP